MAAESTKRPININSTVDNRKNQFQPGSLTRKYSQENFSRAQDGTIRGDIIARRESLPRSSRVSKGYENESPVHFPHKTKTEMERVARTNFQQIGQMSLESNVMCKKLRAKNEEQKVNFEQPSWSFSSLKMMQSLIEGQKTFDLHSPLLDRREARSDILLLHNAHKQ